MKSITLRIKQDLYDELVEVAKEEHLTVAGFVRRAIARGIDQVRLDALKRQEEMARRLAPSPEALRAQRIQERAEREAEKERRRIEREEERYQRQLELEQARMERLKRQEAARKEREEAARQRREEREAAKAEKIAAKRTKEAKEAQAQREAARKAAEKRANAEAAAKLQPRWQQVCSKYDHAVVLINNVRFRESTPQEDQDAAARLAGLVRNSIDKIEHQSLLTRDPAEAEELIAYCEGMFVALNKRMGVELK